MDSRVSGTVGWKFFIWMTLGERPPGARFSGPGPLQPGSRRPIAKSSEINLGLTVLTKDTQLCFPVHSSHTGWGQS